jgi:hypothetical protein
MPQVSQADFKAKSEELFEETKKEASRLKDAVLMKQINELIEEARTLLKANKADEAQLKWEQAGERIAEVRTSIGQEPLANRLLRAELGYLTGLLLIAYLTYQVPHFFLWDGLINLHTQTAWAGAFGGVTIALYGLYSHIQKRDFDPHYKLWYLCKPIIGGIFGWFVFLIYYVGLISVQTDLKLHQVRTPELPLIIAFLAGFSERFTIRIIDRLMQVLTTWQDKSTPSKEKKTT